jgi:sugar phosphate isomerase/epimerase
VSTELGIFARIFPRNTAPEVAAAVAGAGFTTTQLNLSSLGLPTLPDLEALAGLAAIGEAFQNAGVHVWGLSATFNMAHPDRSRCEADTARAVALTARAPEVGAGFVTLCTGSRDAENMWRAHPANESKEAWGDMRSCLDDLLIAAERSGVRLGIEPEPGNVVADAARGKRLLDELGADSKRVGIILDPANLVQPSTLPSQHDLLAQAFELLGDHTVALHAKDVLAAGGYGAAGTGQLDYDFIFQLHAGLAGSVPVIVQDAAPSEVADVRRFLLAKVSAFARGTGP